jgi:eukaryotic-like serine/threonine-protein kinase
MGEVYRARDARLDRILAVKVLPAEVAADPTRLRRFALEARAASALNHPSIVAVYDVGTEGSVSYIAMEYVDGQSLQELLRLGSLPIKRLLDIAVMVADGLASAHEAGIVHRDIKPANVTVAKEGYVKILDFGLAKLTTREGTGGGTESTTRSTPGAIAGTVRYMSPEQARGDPVDFRSDQFSLGSMLYEMATSRPAFQGETNVETMAAILRLEPAPMGPLNPSVPAPLRWIIERCHAKEPADRYSSTRDLARELRSLRDHLGEISTVPRHGAERPRSMRRLIPMLALALAMLGAAVWLGRAFGVRPAPDPDFRRLTLRQGAVYRALFVPRSNSILYTAAWEGQPVRSYLTLPESKGADRSLEAEIQLPMAYSEDGSEALVLLGRSRPAINAFGTLAWWPALGGKPRPILERAGWSDWAPRARALLVVREEGSERTLDLLDARAVQQRSLFRTGGAISYVRVSPDEKLVAFIHHPSRSDDAGEVQVASLDGSGSRSVSPRFERCVGLDWNPRTGEIWFTATQENIYRTTLWATSPSGRPHIVYSMPDFFVLNDVSEQESLFVSSTGGINLVMREEGGRARDYTWLGYTMVFDISPDGKSIVFLDGGATGQSVGTWVRPLNGGEAVRIADGDPGKFSPDGRWVVTASRVVHGLPQLAIVPAGGGPIRQITHSPAAHSHASFAGAGTLLFVRSEGARREVWRMAEDGSDARLLAETDCIWPTADPAGQSFLCLREQPGTLLLYPLAGGPGRTLHQLPSGGSFVYARWNASGKHVLAVTRDWRLLTLHPVTGALLRTETISFPEAPATETLRAAALSPDAAIQAYSISHFSSRLYLGRGL